MIRDNIVDFNQYFEPREEETGAASVNLLGQKGPYQDVKIVEGLVEGERQKWLRKAHSGWTNRDEKNFLSIYRDLATQYKLCGRYREALAIFQELYALDTTDQLDIRYEILSLYVILSDFPTASSFFNSRENFGEDGAMALLYLVAALMAGEEEIARGLFDDLLTTIDGFEYLAVQRDFPFDEVQQFALHSAYVPGTLSEIYWAFFAIFPVSLVAGPYIQSFFNSLIDIGELFRRMGTFLVATRLKAQVTDYLKTIGITTVEELSQLTEEEFLAIKGVGPKVLEMIKREGAVFKQPD